MILSLLNQCKQLRADPSQEKLKSENWRGIVSSTECIGCNEHVLVIQHQFQNPQPTFNQTFTSSNFVIWKWAIKWNLTVFGAVEG